MEPFGRTPTNPNTGLPYLVDEYQEEADRISIADDPTETCTWCGKPLVAMIFRGTGVCSDDCRKQKLGEPTEERALAP